MNSERAILCLIKFEKGQLEGGLTFPGAVHKWAGHGI